MLKRKRWGLAVLWLMGGGCGSSGGPELESQTRCTEASVCDDRLDCTTDSCQEFCEHAPVHSRCPAGTICDPGQGCISSPVCESSVDCPDFGGCSIPACEAATCFYLDLDDDGDGEGPPSCGGLDCDDSRDTAYPGAQERCNNLDDDCDGEIDGFSEACGTDEGECTAGVQSCENGSPSACSGVGPENEVCDRLDNDCDGDTDEDFDICAPNIGAWCDPAGGSGQGEINLACEGDARCLDYADGNGMCVAFGCRQDNTSTGTNEDSCRLDYGNDYVCIDISGNTTDTNLADNVCVAKCTPSDSSNPCDDAFACTANSRRFNFKDTVCFDLACTDGADCPVSVTHNTACLSEADCPGATDFCVLSVDDDDDGIADLGACSEAGICNTTNGLCAPHSLGSAISRIGDPCQADTDCGDGEACVNEGPFADVNGIRYRVPRNGYCTMFGCMHGDASGHVCPAGSGCYTVFAAGACMDTCDPEDPTGCRDDLDADGDPMGNGTPCNPAMGITTDCDWYGDYECLDWDMFTWSVDGTPVVLGVDPRICEYVAPVQRTCADFTNFGCAALAPLGNPTGMDCRYPRTGLATPSNADEDARCLDGLAGGTNSGPLCPGTWDIDGNCIP